MILEIPAELYRKATSVAARRGQTVDQFVVGALREKLAVAKGNSGAPPWMRLFGAGKKYADSIRQIDREIEREFEQVESFKDADPSAG
jgi:hypothetical protein